MISDNPEKGPCVDEMLESIRRLKAQDSEAFRRPLAQISRDENLALSKEVLAPARTLSYPVAELLDAVDACGLTRTYGFLRRETEKRRLEPKQRLMLAERVQ